MNKNQKYQSGNAPGGGRGGARTGAGRPPGSVNKQAADVRELAGVHTSAAVATLARIMNDPTAAHASQVAAANALLDRACGRPVQAIEQKVEGAQFVMMLPAVAASEDEWLKQMQSDVAVTPAKTN